MERRRQCFVPEIMSSTPHKKSRIGRGLLLSPRRLLHSQHEPLGGVASSLAHCLRRSLVRHRSRRIFILRLSSGFALSPSSSVHASSVAMLACWRAIGRSCVKHRNNNLSATTRDTSWSGLHDFPEAHSVTPTSLPDEVSCAALPRAPTPRQPSMAPYTIATVAFELVPALRESTLDNCSEKRLC